MVTILNELHRYVPMNKYTAISQRAVGGQVCNYSEEVLHVKCHQVFSGGDQQTVKRARSAIAQ